MTRQFQIPDHLLFDGTVPTSAAEMVLAELEVAENTLSPWKRMRLGKITGSEFHRVTRDKGGKGWSEGAKSYMAELLFEWATGEEANKFSGNAATEWGEQYEPEAILKYEAKTGRKVKRGQFFLAENFSGLVGCTPDGVGERGLENKCPYGPKAHMYTLLTKKVPPEYMDQVYGHMLCAKRDYCDFTSYDPRLRKRPDLELVVVEVEKNGFYMEDLEGRLYDFEQDLILNLDQLEIDWRTAIKNDPAILSI